MTTGFIRECNIVILKKLLIAAYIFIHNTSQNVSKNDRNQTETVTNDASTDQVL